MSGKVVVVVKSTEVIKAVMSTEVIKAVALGPQGPQGPQGPESPKDWGHYATECQYTGTQIESLPGHVVLPAIYGAVTIYRVITDAMNARGYPVADAFYSNYSEPPAGPSGLLAARSDV